MPQDEDLALIQKYLQAHRCKTLWDVGGGNGVITHMLQQATGLDCALIDPLAHLYTEIPHVTRYNQTAQSIASRVDQAELVMADALFISWPMPSLFYTKLIQHSNVKVVILVDDHASFCGVNATYRQVHYEYGLVRCFAYPTKDQWSSWSCVHQKNVLSYHDLKYVDQKPKLFNILLKDPKSWKGRLRIFIRSFSR